MNRKLLLSAFAVACATSGVAAADDPAALCREAHGGNAEERIACLEDAIAALLDGRPVGALADTGQEAPADANSPSGLGAEQVVARQRARGERPDEPEKPRQTETVRITEVAYTEAGRAIFIMDDGQIWRESEIAGAHSQRIPANRQYSAEIRKSLFGGYRMNIDGVTRMVKVERLK